MTREELAQEFRDLCLTELQVAYALAASDEYAAHVAEEASRRPYPPRAEQHPREAS